jgi:hypothetical protein
LAYAEKVFGLSLHVIGPVSDRRPEPRTTTTLVVKSALALFWTRLGSLNALELTGLAKCWKTRLGRSLCSAEAWGASAYIWMLALCERAFIMCTTA